MNETDAALQEQAWYLMRNLAENEIGVEMIFRELKASLFLAQLTRALGVEDDDVVLQVAYVLGNLANGAQTHLIAAPSLLAALRSVLAERGPAIRRPAVSAVLELARTSTTGRRALLDAGVGATLRQIASAHHHFSHALGGGGSGGFPGRDVSASPGGIGGGGGGGGLRGSHMDDDRDVIEQAKTALDWLEHGEAYR